MEDLLVDREQLVIVELVLFDTSKEDSGKLDRKAQSTIRLCLADSVLLKLSVEDTVKKLWVKLGNLYQSNSIVNEFFLWKKVYLMRMSNIDLITEQLNALNTIISQLLCVDIKITDEDKCISLLCSLLDSWYNLVMAIGSNNTTLKLDNVFATLLSEEMRQENTEGSTPEALSMRG